MGSSRPQNQLPRWVREHRIPHCRRDVRTLRVKHSNALKASLKREFHRLLPALRSTRPLFDEEKQTAEVLLAKWTERTKFASPVFLAEGRLSKLAASSAYDDDPEVAKLVNSRIEEEAMCTMALLMCKKALSPERNLVTDVLLKIFHYLAEELTPTPCGPGVVMLPSLVGVSQVCRRWRTVVLGDQSLWRKAHVVCDGFSSPQLAMRMVETFYTDRFSEISMGITLTISETDRRNDDVYLRSLPRTNISEFLRFLPSRPGVCARVSALSLHSCKPFDDPLPPSLNPSLAASLVNLEAFTISKKGGSGNRSRRTDVRLQRFLECLPNPEIRFTFKWVSECIAEDVLRSTRRSVVPNTTRVTQIGGGDRDGPTYQGRGERFHPYTRRSNN